MSYEIPVVTINSWANSEIVENGKTGFVVDWPRENWLPIADFLPRGKAKQVERKGVDFKLIEKLAEKVSILIQNPKLRRMMGKAAREEVERGKFSLKMRNEKLKQIFDEATTNSLT